jgi:hypothetical protein
MTNTKRTPDEQERAKARNLIQNHGLRGAARVIGVHHTALTRAANGGSVSEGTLIALRARTKTADDYKDVSRAFRSPKRKKPSSAWTLDAIRSAREAQSAGDFAKAAPLAQAMLLDDALFVAAHNRVAPIGSLGLDYASTGGIMGDKVASRAREELTVTRGTLISIALAFVFHGVAFGQVTWSYNEDGTRVYGELREWPIEHVKWDDNLRQFVTKVEDGDPVPIVHGDGQWVVFSRFDLDAFRKEACLLPACLIMAAHVDAIRDWASASRSHGQAKIVGELPEGVPIQQGDEGALSPDAAYFLDMLAELTSGEAGAGLRPAGSKTDFLANGSTAWQVFSELALNREKAAARVFLGNDGTLGSVGGAPGVDISALFGVATTKVQGDVNTLEGAIYSGLIVPWCAMSFGDSAKAPRLAFDMPDPDAAQRVEQLEKATNAMLATLKAYKENGFTVNQTVVDALAKSFGVTAPILPATGAERPSVALAPTDVAKVIRVAEARAAQGLPPFGDFRDTMTITELDEKIKADAAARAAAASTPNGAPPA